MGGCFSPYPETYPLGFFCIQPDQKTPYNTLILLAIPA
jgi:hypothetical protein